MLLSSNEYSNGEDKKPSPADKYMKQLMTYCETKLKSISDDNKFNGFIVFLFHYILLFIVLLFAIVFTLFLPLIMVLYFSGCVLFYPMSIFRGCLLTKVERHLWKTKEWLGPQFFFYDSCSLSNVMLQNLFICKVIFIATIIYLRILFNY